MTPDRWQQIEELYHLALEREENQRVAFLNEACAGDDALRREIESLLAEEKGAEGFLESPAVEVVAKEMAQSQIQSLVGQQLGSHYEILGKLGEGGMGVLYRALDTRLDRTIAIKILRPETVGDAERKRRF